MSASWVTTMMVTPRSRLSETQRLHDLVRGARIEIAGRLVGEQQARRVDERAGDGDTLLLAAGKLRRRVALAVAEAEQRQRVARARQPRRTPGPAPLARIEQRQRDVLDARSCAPAG